MRGHHPQCARRGLSLFGGVWITRFAQARLSTPTAAEDSASAGRWHSTNCRCAQGRVDRQAHEAAATRHLARDRPPASRRSPGFAPPARAMLSKPPTRMRMRSTRPASSASRSNPSEMAEPSPEHDQVAVEHIVRASPWRRPASAWSRATTSTSRSCR